jgi:DNA primase
MSLISQTTIDKLRELPILEVVTRYSDIHLKKTGATFKGLSPWGAEKSPSFFVHPGKNIYKDFSTGKGGNNAIAFVMDKEGVDFVDAIKSLAGQWSIDIEYTKDAAENGHKAETRKEIREAMQWALAHFCANEVPESFTKYREFPEDVLNAFKIGYAKPSWNDVTAAAIKAGFSPEVLTNAGLIRKRESSEGYYDFFRDRIMFPVFDSRGNVVAFSGRDAESDNQTAVIDKKEPEFERPPKYINSPDTAYDKSKNLFGLYQALKIKNFDKGIYQVEGPTDVMRMYQFGLPTVAPCGSALTDEQAKLIRKYTDKIIMVPDNDCAKEKNAGIDALHRNAPIAIKAGLQVKVLIPGSLKGQS